VSMSSMIPFPAMPTAIRSVLLLILVGSLLGLSVVAGKAAIDAGWPPLALVVWAMLGAGGLQVVVLRLSGTTLNFDAPRLRYYAVSGVLFALPNALGYLAVQHIGAAIVALCFAFPLMFTYGLSLLFRYEKLNMVRFAGVLAGLTGAVIIALGGRIFGDAAGLPDSPWLYVALANPTIIALANIYRTTHWPAGASAQELSPGMLIVGGLAILAFVTLAGFPLAPSIWGRISIVFVVAQIFIFAALYVLYFVLQNLAGPVYLSQIGSVAALVGIVLAIVFLGEPASPALLIAGLPIGLGIYLVTRTNH